MARTPKGTTFQLFTSLGSALPVSGISNATEAVVTSTAHGLANGDYVMVDSGWGRLNKRAFRIKSVTANTFVLEGMDTTNTEFYPAGSGTGTVKKGLTPVSITQILSANSSGGDAKQVTYGYMESDVEFNINDGFTAVQRQFSMDADAFGGTAYGLLRTLTETGAETILRTVLKGGSFTLAPCTVALNEEVLLQDGQVNRVNFTINQTNRSVRY